MVGKLRCAFLVLAVTLVPLLDAEAQGKGKVPPGLAKKGGIPPGQAKRGCLPPGLAKKLGPNPPCRVYMAVDPAHEDRVWFLVEGGWVFATDIAPDARMELRAALQLDIPAPPPPPVPLPKVGAELRLMLFSD